MEWVTLSLISTLGQVSRNAVMKRIGHQLDEYINVLGRFVFLLPFAAAAVLWKGTPEVKPGFVWACLLFGVSQTCATLSLSKALHYGNIGVVTSLWKLAIIWLVILSFFTLGEVPSALSFVGIAITLLGVYGLNVSRARLSFWAPLRSLFTDKGQRYTLICTLFYAPSVVTFKWAALLSDSAFATFWVYLAAALCTLPVALWRSSGHFRQVPLLWKWFFGMGLFAFIASITQAMAYRITFTSYVESVKQTEILFAIAVGYLFFGERERLSEATLGGVIIMAGVVFLFLGS